MEPLNAIKHRHESDGKMYPRPKIECPECGNECVVCWGPKINVYLRHPPESIKKCKVSKESIEHMLAKKLLCEYLSSGGSVCVEHDNGNRSTVPVLHSWKQEASHVDCRYDIGGYSDKESLEYGIEIWRSHKTTNVAPRTVTWIEVRSRDVLELLDSQDVPRQITLVDQREYFRDSVFEEITDISNDKEFCDWVRKNSGKRQCFRCKQHLISPGAPSFILMCYDCQDQCSPEEQEVVNQKTGWRKCHICSKHEIHPRSPLHYNVCNRCQESISFQEVNSARIAAGWRQCFVCSTHSVHPKSPVHYNICKECEKTASKETVGKARASVGWKECVKCREYTVFPQSKYSKCYSCSRLCSREGCAEAVQPPCKSLCPHHTSRKSAKKKPVVARKVVTYTIRPDYRNDGEETFCEDCGRQTYSDWKSMCTRCYIDSKYR